MLKNTKMSFCAKIIVKKQTNKQKNTIKSV